MSLNWVCDGCYTQTRYTVGLPDGWILKFEPGPHHLCGTCSQRGHRDEPPLALQAITPICPQCGARCSISVSPHEGPMSPFTMHEVQCASCRWIGRSMLARPQQW